MEYVKINSLWKREGWYFDQDKKDSPDYKKERQSFIVGDYANPEFGNVKKWLVDEKIDGTNIRIFFDERKIRIGGRTDAAQIPCHLLDYLQGAFDPILFEKVFGEDEGNPRNIILYGEGFGPKIQAGGGNYRDKPGFMLFDVFINGWWLQRDSVRWIAEGMGLETVPEIGIMTEEEIVAFVKSHPMSRCSARPQVMEGVVCRSEPLMLFRNKKPIMFKLKCKEFKDEVD